MAIRVRNTKSDYVPAPEGLHRAVCCDIVELGLQETPWGKKRKVEIKWQIEELMENGKPYLVGKRYGASLHPKATLRIDLESWRSRGFTDQEADDFDLETLLGVNCQLNITHNKTDAGTFANVKAIVPPAKGLPALKARDYQRVKDREGYEAPPAGEDEPGADDGPPLDDDIPF